MNKTSSELKGWLFLLALLFLSNNAYSEKYLFKLIDNVYYTLDSDTKEAEVEKFTIPTDSKQLYVGNITIPEEVTFNQEHYKVTAIGPFAFEDCTQLTAITLPETIKTIGTAAFRNCSGLTSINLPSGLTTIEGSAFSNCTGITSFEIPNSVTTIDYSAFSNCNGLTSFEMPNSVTTIGSGVLLDCINLKSVTLSTSLNDIGSRVFGGCVNLTSIVNLNSLDVLGESMFDGCSSLATVELSPNLQTIPRSLFYNCTSLAEIVLPKGITTMGNYPFWGCTNLRTIHAYMVQPPTIDSYAFKDVPSTAKVYVPLGSRSAYSSATGWKAFSIVERVEAGDVFTSTTKEGVNMSYTITDVEKMKCEVGTNSDASAIGTTTSGRVTIPSSVNISVGEVTVVRIGGNAFKDCGNLSELVIPESVSSIEYIGEISGVDSYGAFIGCSNLNSIYVKAATPFATNEKAFDGIPTNAKLYVPFGAKSSYENATGWSRFTSVVEQYLEDDIISAQTVEGVTMLFRVINAKENTCEVVSNGYEPTIDKEYNGTVTIPSEVGSLRVVRIGERAFAQSKVGSVVMPESIEKIGRWAFFECVNLTSINLPNSVIEIEGVIFAGCPALISPVYNSSLFVYMPSSYEGKYTIPSGITKIMSNAFSGCSNLTGISFPSSLTTIEDETFLSCRGLESVILPGNITNIGSNAFRYTNISSVEFLHSKEQLDALTWSTTNTNDFKGPSGTTLKFSADVTNKVDIDYFVNQREDGFRYWANADKKCFYDIEGASLFLKVTNGGNVSWIPVNGVLENGAFRMIYGNPIDKNTAGVLDLSSVNSKKNGEGNSYKITEISAYAFFQYPNLTSVIIGNDVTSIGREAFAECTNLASVTIGSGLTSLSRELFRGDPKLATVMVPEGITALEIGVFCDCTGLTSVSLPSTLTAIGTDAFYNCGNLKFVSIPAGVVRIEKSLFSNCENITVVFPSKLEYIGQKTIKDVKCAIFTSLTPPEIGSGSVEYTVNQISVPFDAVDTYTALFASQKTISVSSVVGYSTIPVEINIVNTPVTSCKATATSYILQNGTYTSKKENCSAYGLTPETPIEQIWTLEDGNRVIYKTSVSNALTFETLPAKDLSNTKATISAKTNGDDNAQRFGFEWRRYDAPDEMPSNTILCSVNAGVMETSLNGLTANTYYKYRPFYKSDAGSTFYGEWIAFITADIQVDPVVVTAKSYTIKYGDELPTYEFTSEGTKLEGTPSITCDATKASSVGTYPIVITKGSVTNENATFVNGTLTIEKAPLTITAKSYTVNQGDELPTFEAEYSGFKNEETFSVLTKAPVLTSTATSTSPPGEYDINISGAEAQNYEMSYVKGKLTIEKVDVDPVTGDSSTEFSEKLNGNSDLSNTVIDNTYYNMDSTNGDGYDAAEQAIVLNSTTTAEQMNAVQNAAVGDVAVRENYNGIIFELAAGRGAVYVDVRTIGTHVLNVQIGKGTPMKVTKSEREMVGIDYDVSEPTYVYLYATTASGSNAPLNRASASGNSVLLYGYKVTPGSSTGINTLTADEPEESKWYTVDGRKLQGRPTAKGLYIKNGRKVVVQ